MFDAVRNNKKIVQIFLALIALPFALWGVDAYVRNAAKEGDVASIGDIKISQRQFQEALRERQERLRAQLGANFDAKAFDTPEIRRAILNEMLDQRVLMLEAAKSRLTVNDEALRRALNEIPVFQENGKFSAQRYEEALRSQGMTPATFEAQMRQDMTLQQLAGVIARTDIPSRFVNERLLAMQAEKREVREYRFPTESFLGQVKLEEGAAKKFYDANPKEFEVAEQARAEYVVLSQDVVGKQVVVSDAEIKAWYDSHKERFAQSEERRASHILIKKETGKAKAEELLKEVQKNPASFAELAKKNSQDPGSASKGGDLGFVARGAMVKSFEDALFKLKEGETSGIVESEFGFHIIRAVTVRGAKEKTLAEVRGEIEAELKKQMAARKFAEAAEAFSNLVYEQADSLKPAADKFKLTIQQTAWIGRAGEQGNAILSNEKLMKSLFAEDAVKNKRNTEAVEVAPNTLVAARIAEYRPAALQPFDAVKDVIEAKLKREQAQDLARKAGEAKLAELTKGGQDAVAWGESKAVSRLDSRLVPPAAVSSVFKVDSGKLPGYAGVNLGAAGYALFKVEKTMAGDKIEDVQKKAMASQFDRLGAQQEIQAYTAALKIRHKVKIDQAALEAKEK